MNGFIDMDFMERRQDRVIRWMVVLSILFHGGIGLLGTTFPFLFSTSALPTVMTVELSDVPMPSLPQEDPLPPPAPSLDSSPKGTPSDSPAPRRPEARPKASADRWLQKLDSGLARVGAVPAVARDRSRDGDLPARRWEDGPVRKGAGDFAPTAALEKSAALGQHLDALETRLRRYGRPGIGTGKEVEAQVMFGGVGDSEGEPIPPWIRDMIRNRVRGYLAELETTYSAAYRRNPDLKGKLLVRFRIDPSGKIQRADFVESSVPDGPFIATVLEKVRRWTFDPTSGRTVEVLYPFVFVAPS